ncbi:hypothetical protein KM043_013228 [Ampulex compressa]|nr:hypothetical protein KM043_013228 [Ampulex compressa]
MNQESTRSAIERLDLLLAASSRLRASSRAETITALEEKAICFNFYRDKSDFNCATIAPVEAATGSSNGRRKEERKKNGSLRRSNGWNKKAIRGERGLRGSSP